MPPRKERFTYPGMLHDLSGLPESTHFWNQFGVIIDRMGENTPWRRSPIEVVTESQYELRFGEVPLADELKLVRLPGPLYEVQLNSLKPAYAQALNLLIGSATFEAGDIVSISQAHESIQQLPAIRVVRGESMGTFNQVSPRFLRALMFSAGVFDVRANPELEKSHGEFVQSLEKSGKKWWWPWSKEVSGTVDHGLLWQKIALAYDSLLGPNERWLVLRDPVELARAEQLMNNDQDLGVSNLRVQKLSYSATNKYIETRVTWNEASEVQPSTSIEAVFRCAPKDDGFELWVSDDQFSSELALHLMLTGLESMLQGGTIDQQRQLVDEFSKQFVGKVKSRIRSRVPFLSWSAGADLMNSMSKQLAALGIVSSEYVVETLLIQAESWLGFKPRQIEVQFTLRDTKSRSEIDLLLSVLPQQQGRHTFGLQVVKDGQRYEEIERYGFDSPVPANLLVALVAGMRKEE